MDTDMGMAMDTAMVLRVKSRSVFLSSFYVLASFPAFSAELELTPFALSEFTYTDNVDLVAENKESSEIATLAAGLEVKSEGNDGNLSLDYQIRKLFYSHDSVDNATYNELSFTADKGLFSQTQFRADANASIDNIARSIRDNANNDIVTSDTIETKNFGVGLSYQSNPRGVVDLSARIDSDVTLNEDNIGDNNEYSAELSFDNGKAIKKIFWTTDYSYTTNIGRSDNSRTQIHELEHKFGLQQMKGVSPFIGFNLEDYIGQSNIDSADTTTLGPGVRYYWHRRSFIELAYEFDLKGDGEDFWSGEIYLIPTPRTALSFEYTKRFYGDAYDFSFRHKNKRLTNSITYVEEISGYNRRTLVDGNRVEELTVNKTLTWESSLELRRNTFTLELRGREQEAISDLSQNADTDSYGSTFSVEHNLTRKATLSSSFKYDYYKFGREGQSATKDHYRIWDLGLEVEPIEELSVDITLAHSNRTSTNLSSEYKENRVNLSLRKDF
ncbi:TIGR03016 family PEP-CTERM system-associated outer membrane protein [Vibrio sp. HN007]|uniref:TIGR03016 family PEP-CTERM system-associated outer membrane protein n=1 Tax=Vibrio iocasae TaxID=3098914 RepID=UPI0035D4F4EC